jgi:hypothetical protein
MRPFAATLLCLSLLLTASVPVRAAATPSLEEMWQLVQAQQKTIAELQTRLTRAEGQVQETVSQVEATADAVEQVAATSTSVATAKNRTSVGGYGELHYNNLEDDHDQVGGDDSLSQADFHRFIIYLGHEFNDRLRFFSELEVEHTLVEDGTGGAVELEQAWLEMDLNPQHHLRAGLDILPIGIINMTHEPNTFYGVERNPVETEIIPATWWEAGLALHGELAPGWNYDAVLHSGLAAPTTGDEAFRPRDARLEVTEAEDQDAAFTGRVRYTGIPGLELGVSAQYQRDYTGTADDVDIDAKLVEAHVDWKHRSGFGLRALYARWDLGRDGSVDPGAVNADDLTGWYIEPAWRFRLPGEILGELGVFARYSEWDERNLLPALDFRYEEFRQLMLGFNWWPHPNVVFKFDAQWEHAGKQVDQALDGINIGIGYQF